MPDTELSFAVHDVIAATGFVTQLPDLPQGGRQLWPEPLARADTVRGKLDSAQHLFRRHHHAGSQLLKKLGIPSNSGAVQGHRYNARVLAHHLAEARFGMRMQPHRVDAEAVVTYLLSEASRSPELWHQRSYLARVLVIDADRGIVDEGIVPPAHFVDTSGPDAVAIALESNGRDDPYPAVYVRTQRAVTEHLLEPHPMLDFEGDPYRKALMAAHDPVLSPSLSRPQL